MSYKLYWGDFHKHIEDLSTAALVLSSAKANLDFYAVLEYPFGWSRIGSGLNVESTGNTPLFVENWEKFKALAEEHYEPGSFVTFVGYEWNGNRTRWGDHNVIYREPREAELLDTRDLPDLYKKLQGKKVFAIPHHTGYCIGNRGKDWDAWDEHISPIAEVFSYHGSSEGCETPYPMEANGNMAPRVDGGSYRDALARGYRVGVIGSNDHAGLPGSWGGGIAAVWAEDKTRESIWKAFEERRCYAVTGDRIKLQFHVNDVPMGGELDFQETVEAKAKVECSQSLDRIELIHNGRVVRTYCHQDVVNSTTTPKIRKAKVLIECGWGPSRWYGWPPKEQVFNGCAVVTHGAIEDVEPRLKHLGQSVTHDDQQTCSWQFKQPCQAEGQQPMQNRQGVILTISDPLNAILETEVNGHRLTAPVAELFEHGLFHAYLAEARNEVEQMFEVSPETRYNPDVLYHNARKVKIHAVVPEHAYCADISFKDIRMEPGVNSLYVRVSQLNGQMAWSSPVWVKG